MKCAILYSYVSLLEDMNHEKESALRLNTCNGLRISAKSEIAI